MTTHQESSPRSQGLGTVLETLRRRKTLALVPFVFVVAAAASLAFFLPSLWTARATVMVDRQHIPESFVKSTVTSDTESRLLTLSQSIMAPERLAAIVQQYDLYPQLRARGATTDEVVEAMRKDIRIEYGDNERDRSRRERDARTVVFGVTYATSDPVVAMNVANTLADLYVAENLKFREQVAVGASDFLESQLTEVRKKLAEQEKRIAQYKEQHLGELPEQREANLRTLERLQAQLAVVNETHRRAVERRQQLTQALGELDTSGAGGLTSAPPPAGSTAARLNLLRQELAQLLTKYSDRYPDVIYTRDQIKAMEAKLAEEQGASALPRQDAKASGLRAVPQNSYVASLMSQIDQAKIEIKAGAEQTAAIQRQIAAYERRIENTPRREHELASITRDYETTREVFRSLLAKRDEAGIAADLEQRQKGEQFRVLQAATLPERPTGPNRIRLLLVGLALAIGASAAAVVLAENVDTSFRRVEEVRARLPVPVLSTIPRITTESDLTRVTRQRRLATAGIAIAVLAIVGSSYAIAHNNHNLVGLLTPDTTTTKR
jgi:polysaccharide chain length determinant protein (PEP-CTERM system associated)